jgi:hypothetical protein
VFPEKNSLPGAEEQPALGERHRFARARERHLDMTRHVIGAFEGVREMRVVLGHESVEPRLQIAARRGVGIFHDDQAAARVLAEDGRDPAGESTRRNFAGDLVGDFLQAAPAGAEAEGRLVSGHLGPQKRRVVRPASENLRQIRLRISPARGRRARPSG